MLRRHFLSKPLSVPILLAVSRAYAHADPTVDRRMTRAGREYGVALQLAWSGNLNDARTHVLIATRVYEQLLHPPAPFVGGHYVDAQVLLAAIATLMGDRRAKQLWTAAETAYRRYSYADAYRRSLYFEPDRLFNAGKRREAFAAYSRLYPLQTPYDVPALYASMQQGLTAASAGNFRGAEIPFRSAVTLEPQYTFGLLMHGLTLVCLSKKREACTELAKETIAYFPSITMRRFTVENLSGALAILRFC